MLATVSSAINGHNHNSAMSASYLPADKYRGAVVEDLQLPPAFSLPDTESLSRAIDLAYDRDFSHIPILHSKNRRPLGYIDVGALKSKWEAGNANPDDKVDAHMTRFKRTSSEPYRLITPWTPLAELEDFLTDFPFALVTDEGRKFVIAVATVQDLNQFFTRRGM